MGHQRTEITPELADVVFAALAAGWQDPYRLELYLARVALDLGERAMAAYRAGEIGEYRAFLLAYRRIEKGLVASGYWAEDAG